MTADEDAELVWMTRTRLKGRCLAPITLSCWRRVLTTRYYDISSVGGRPSGLRNLPGESGGIWGLMEYGG